MRKEVIQIGKESEAIQKIYEDMYAHTNGTDGISMIKFSGSWGYRNSKDYLEQELDYNSTVVMLAKACNVRFYDGNFYYYDGKIYSAVSADTIEAAFSQLLEHYRIAVMMNNTTVFRKKFLQTVKFYNRLYPRHDLLGFQNGVLDILNDKWYEFSPELHVTKCHEYKYDPKARCPKWQAFLKEMLPSKNSRTILQMFMGLGLMERGTVYDTLTCAGTAKVELCLILIGSGSNGKSVIYQTMMGIYGGDKISSMDYDELTAYGDEGMRARRQLRGAIFNWSSDSNPNTFGSKRTGVFKRIVSGEPVSDREIGGNVQENCQLPYLIFNLNDLPYPDDESLGFIRRLQFVTFEVIIPRSKQNKYLAFELTKEYPGIFNWMKRGMLELKRRRFNFPSTSEDRKMIVKTQLRTNPVEAFLTAYNIRPTRASEMDDGCWVSTKDLLDSIYSFCDDNDVVGHPSRQKFGVTMSKHGFKKSRMSEGCTYNIYGCNKNGLKHNFIIDNESFETTYSYNEEKPEKDTELTEED